jgi:predicted RNA-binding protein with PUA-like domain
VGHWLLKTEPGTFGIEHLAALPQRTSPWDGVRNYQARNFLRDQVRRGEEAFIYHSSCAQPGIVGIVSVARAAYPDASAFDRRHKHFDADSDPQAPRWFVIDVQLQRRLNRVITLEELRARGWQTAGHATTATWQSTLGDARRRCSLGVHPVARVTVNEFTSAAARSARLFFCVSCIYSVPGLT